LSSNQLCAVGLQSSSVWS